MLAVVGLGQAGGNIAEEFSKLGVLSGAINYSQKDLESIDVKHKLRLLGSEGVGKVRNSAISLFQDQWETAIAFIRDNFSNAKVIAFAFSSSGGSGSGISPILLDIAINMFPDTVFVALVVIPEIKEAESSQLNCISTFEELSAMDVCVLPIDNQQIRIQNPSVGKNRLYEISNQEAALSLFKLVEYTNKYSKNGNFDEKDLLTVLKTKGIATISELQLSTSIQNINLTPEGVSEKVNQSWHNSVFAPLSTDRVQRAAVVSDCQESMMDFIRTDILFDSFHTPPVDLFEGIYNEHSGRIVTILTGLSWSFERLKQIESSLMSKQKVSTPEETFSYRASSSIIKPIVKKQEKKTSVMDILSKYNR